MSRSSTVAVVGRLVVAEFGLALALLFCLTWSAAQAETAKLRVATRIVPPMVIEKNGTLSIPVVPGGQLAYVYANAQAKAGKITIESKNPQSTAHDISIEGNGVNAKGAVVQNGGTSKFSTTLKPGTYTFFCSVDGHRQGGMVGRLTVK